MVDCVLPASHSAHHPSLATQTNTMTQAAHTHTHTPVEFLGDIAVGLDGLLLDGRFHLVAVHNVHTLGPVPGPKGVRGLLLFLQTQQKLESLLYSP